MTRAWRHGSAERRTYHPGVKIGRLIISREHPSERALRRYGELSPDLRALIARVVRSTAKDHIQDIMEANGLPFNADGSPLTDEQRAACGIPGPDDPHYISRVAAYGAMEAVRDTTEKLAAASVELINRKPLTPAEETVLRQALDHAFALVRGPM